MKLPKTLVAVLGAILPLAASLRIAIPEGLRAGDKIPGRYIVTLKEEGNITAATSFAKAVHAKSLKRRQNTANPPSGIDHVYEGNFLGYAGSFDETGIEEIRNSRDVVAVEEDAVSELCALTTQQDPGYGLASISHHEPHQNTYVYDDSAGEGGYAYVIDGGINDAHVEFEGRARLGWTAVNLEPSRNDGGHGTHVAGIIASKTYGVAKKANVIAVRVFYKDLTLVSIWIAGINWAVKDIIRNKRQAKSVINMSAGARVSSALNGAVASAVKQGITVVVSAGNDNRLAKGQSPASAPEVITVSNIDSDNKRAPTANYGALVDVFAPGENIKSTWVGSSTATEVLSGTSMSAPYVAGLVLYLQALENLTTPASIKDRIIQLGTRDLVHDAKGSPNIIAFNGATS